MLLIVNVKYVIRNTFIMNDIKIKEYSQYGFLLDQFKFLFSQDFEELYIENRRDIGIHSIKIPIEYLERAISVIRDYEKKVKK